jgi:hypothetical protein
MPNWCDNMVSISFTDTDEYNKFVKTMGDPNKFVGINDPNDFFDLFVPTPPELLEGNDWWEWRITNWGTKWNPEINYAELYPEVNRADFQMNTAWSPPVTFFTAFVQLYPSATVEVAYLEEGMGFCGKAVITHQEVVDKYMNDIPSSMYKEAGALLDAEGNVDWEQDQEYNLWEVIEDDNAFERHYSSVTA